MYQQVPWVYLWEIWPNLQCNGNRPVSQKSEVAVVVVEVVIFVVVDYGRGRSASSSNLSSSSSASRLATDIEGVMQKSLGSSRD